MQSAKKYREVSKEDPELFLVMARLKLKQMSEIVIEVLKLKKGIKQHTCHVRNMLQVLSGEMEIYCNIDINDEVINIASLLDGKSSAKKWDGITKNILQIYEKILTYCK